MEILKILEVKLNLVIEILSNNAHWILSFCVAVIGIINSYFYYTEYSDYLKTVKEKLKLRHVLVTKLIYRIRYYPKTNEKIALILNLVISVIPLILCFFEPIVFTSTEIRVEIILLAIIFFTFNVVVTIKRTKKMKYKKTSNKVYNVILVISLILMIALYTLFQFPMYNDIIQNEEIPRLIECIVISAFSINLSDLVKTMNDICRKRIYKKLEAEICK